MENHISVLPFAQEVFETALVEASGRDKADIDAKELVTDQIEYLARYVANLGANTIVRESFYVDRHYMDEYASYYSRMLHPPLHHVVRFHAFQHEFDQAQFDLKLDHASSDPEELKAVEAEFSEAYLGFVSVRPVPSVAIGRTVLRRLNDVPGKKRDIWATAEQDVHLANLKLVVEGISFQQQDLAVGACATAALWTALSRVARMEGIRAPTPAEISAAATRNGNSSGRSQPALAGLKTSQLCEAIRSSGFAPEFVRAAPRKELFLVALHTYLLSGIPVVLEMVRQDQGHAVTAVGFQVGEQPNPELEAHIPVRSARVKKLYIHDDRLGPYAMAELLPICPLEDEEGESFGDVMAVAIRTRGSKEKELWALVSAIAPVYPKLRLPVAGLIALADVTIGPIEEIVGSNQARGLSVEFQFQRSGEFLASLSRKPKRSGASVPEFLKTVLLPRWCGIVRWHLDSAPLVEFVYDTTDILRLPLGGRDLLRGVVCLSPHYGSAMQRLGLMMNVPTLA